MNQGTCFQARDLHLRRDNTYLYLVNPELRKKTVSGSFVKKVLEKMVVDLLVQGVV